MHTCVRLLRRRKLFADFGHSSIQLVGADMVFDIEYVDLLDDLGIAEGSQGAELRQVEPCSISIVAAALSAIRYMILPSLD